MVGRKRDKKKKRKGREEQKRREENMVSGAFCIHGKLIARELQKRLAM